MRFYLLIWFLVMHCALAAAPLFRDFMGLNGHTVQFKPELYAPVASLVRDYHPVEWDLGRESDFIPPFPFARNRVNWETVYGSWKKQGWRINVSLMFETLPREQWKNPGADARAYAERFARAFGPSSANPLVESVEIGNEPGKFSDADYRIIFENMARGFRAADPKLKVVTCALTTGASHEYAKSVKCIEGLSELYDVLNVHTYAEAQGWPTWRRSFPEDSNLKKFLPEVERLCEWRDKNAPGKEVWITEFGYDATTKRPDPNTEFKQWESVTDEQQAQWIVRSWLTFASLPVERAYLFFFNDSDQAQVHGASGLTRNFQPKPSFYAVAHLRKTLGDYRFVKKGAQGGVLTAEFANDAGKKILVVWAPYGNGHTAAFSMGGLKIARAERMPLSASEERSVEFSGDFLKVGESPIYLDLE